jgi:hypothetical protein
MPAILAPPRACDRVAARYPLIAVAANCLRPMHARAASISRIDCVVLRQSDGGSASTRSCIVVRRAQKGECMSRVELALIQSTQPLVYTTGHVYDAQGNRMSAEDGTAVVEARLDRGSVLRLPAGRYRYEFTFSRDGDHLIEARGADDLRPTSEPLACSTRGTSLEGWHYDFEAP